MVPIEETRRIILRHIAPLPTEELPPAAMISFEVPGWPEVLP